MKKRIITAVIAAAMFMMLPSCVGVLVPPEGLMRPPAPQGISAEILAAFEGAVGTDYRLRFERGGNHASVITYDLNGNGNLNAAIFYSLLDEDDVLRMHILEYYGGNWTSIYDKTTRGRGVERIEIGYVTSEDVPSIVVGKTSLLDNQRILTVFNLAGRRLEEIFTTWYMEFYVTDITRDGLDDIIFMQYDADNSFINANVATFKDDELYVFYQTGVDSEVTAYISSHSAVIEQAEIDGVMRDVVGVYFDGIKADGRIITELLYIPPEEYSENDSSRLQTLHASFLHAPFTDILTRLNFVTERRSTRHSADILGNGQIAIPIDTFTALAIGGSEDIYITSWKVYQNGSLESVLTAYIDRSGFMFNLEDLTFRDVSVSVAIDEDNRRIFSVFDISRQIVNRELFRIVLTTESWWQENMENVVDFYDVERFQNVVFLVQMIENAYHGDGFDLTLEDVRRRFSIFHDTAPTPN